MEVHKHPHHVTHKKKWGEYLLEFFMLFLAVFLGFVAENIRENIIEHHREKEYIESMVQDLKTDTTNLVKLISSYQWRTKMQDTLMLSLDSINNNQNGIFMHYIKSITGFPDYVNADATVQQLNNSGGFRLIRNRSAIDSIMAYTSRVQSTLIVQSNLSAMLKELNALRYEIINYHAIFKEQLSGKSEEQMEAEHIDYLQTHDKRDLNNFFNNIYRYQNIMRVVGNGHFVPLKQQASRLIAFLQKEYHLE